MREIHERPVVDDTSDSVWRHLYVAAFGRCPHCRGSLKKVDMEAETCNEERLDDVAAKPKESLWNLLAPSLAFAGVQACWAVQTGHGSAFLRKLGLRNELVGLAWLAGPVTGAIVQPIVGRLSDSCTSRFGKRKP